MPVAAARNAVVADSAVAGAAAEVRGAGGAIGALAPLIMMTMSSPEFGPTVTSITSVESTRLLEFCVPLVIQRSLD